MDLDYQRWWALAVDLATSSPQGGPLALVAAELASQLDARGVALVEVSRPVGVRPLGPPCRAKGTPEWYAEHAVDLPALTALEDRGQDAPVTVRTAFGAPSWLARRVEDDGFGVAVAFPVPGPTTAWFVVVRDAGFCAEELALVDGVRRLLHAVGVRTSPPPLAFGGLTEREQAVLRLMAEGHIAEAIGHRLGVSRRTVGKHQEHIYRKLAASDRLSAVLRAQEAGLLTEA